MKRISKEENREDKRLMLERFKTIYMGGTGEIVEKKSRFIATVRLTETEEEALTFIEAVRKKYWNATHNCYAYVIGERKELVRASDDGEPQGTAGHPMLDVLLGEDLYNVTVVVTRYFGGTLLEPADWCGPIPGNRYTYSPEPDYRATVRDSSGDPDRL